MLTKLIVVTTSQRYVSHFAVHLKLIQCCKSLILQQDWGKENKQVSQKNLVIVLCIWHLESTKEGEVLIT